MPTRVFNPGRDTLITTNMLYRMGACSNADTVGEHYPDGAPLTVEAGLKLWDEGANVSWFLMRVLRKKEREQLARVCFGARLKNTLLILRRYGQVDLARQIEQLPVATAREIDQTKRELRDLAYKVATAAGSRPDYFVLESEYNRHNDLLRVRDELRYLSGSTPSDVDQSDMYDWIYQACVDGFQGTKAETHERRTQARTEVLTAVCDIFDARRKEYAAKQQAEQGS